MKKNIIFLLIGMLISGVGVYAVTSISADQVNYDENTTVKDKIDDLYIQANTTISNLSTERDTYKNKHYTMVAGTRSSAANGVFRLENLTNDFTYFKLNSIYCQGNPGSATIIGHPISNWSATENLSLNTKYNISTYSEFDIHSDGNYYCTVIIELYN